MKKLQLLILCLLISSCTSRDSDIFRISPLSFEENKLYLSDIADNVKYIRIDNTKSISYLYATKTTKDRIYLSGKDIGILAYSRDGNFLYNIGNQGRGPGEYVYGLSFAVGDDNKVYVVDNRKILIYNSEGRYIRTIDLNFLDAYFGKIEYSNNTLFLNQASSGGLLKYDWVVLDTLGELISQKMTLIPSFQTNLGGFEGIYKYGDIISIWNCFSDTVFYIHPDLNYESGILFEQGDFRWPRSNLTDLTKLEDYMQPLLLFETNNYIIFRHFYKKPKLAIIDKTSRRSYLTYLVSESNSGVSSYSGGIINDIDGGIDFIPVAYYTEDDREYLLSFLDSFKIKSHVNSIEFKKSNPESPEMKKELENLTASLEETDNPVLVLVRLKK